MIELATVTKKYRHTMAMDSVSLTIPDTGVYCLLGRNGAGKTTFMKLIAGHIRSTSGTITIDGVKVSPGRMPDCVSYIESDSVQFNMRVSDLIDTACLLQESFDRDFAKEMTERFELNPRKRFRQLSLGMKTMLTTIISLANNSTVILLDEPTLGLDPIVRDRFNTMLLESYDAHPRVIIVSTHQMDEIAQVTQRLIIIDQGKLLMEAGIDEIDEKAYTLSGPTQEVLPLVSGLNCIGTTQAGGVLAAHIFDQRIAVPEGVSVDRLGLKDFFINIVRRENHA
ncbi:MAG: ABC transporter ATP-binding protein [Propionibacteriaceae bacterium]|nr:ABC transporter ATP-binding protein [Propionibacteriaceae bacterium]